MKKNVKKGTEKGKTMKQKTINWLAGVCIIIDSIIFLLFTYFIIYSIEILTPVTILLIVGIIIIISLVLLVIQLKQQR